jgi:hypothetical protein
MEDGIMSIAFVDVDYKGAGAHAVCVLSSAISIAANCPASSPDCGCCLRCRREWELTAMYGWEAPNSSDIENY